ncbi:unnamed protein product [Cercopithifilaria johnstoni]|uniref:Uncharacterized protein n=1 Tax=Cercopithifilaria johnstoni TaxID=2874296 RepID=A0A8J2LYT5_9BILA|nr:unnamed protein product [Cercopithifilaria johnstoni]
MDQQNIESERSMEKPSMMTFEMKKHIIEERIADVKESMHALRNTMQETTNEVKGIFHRVMKLQNIVDDVSENVKIQLDESKKIREKKVKLILKAYFPGHRVIEH